MKITKTKAFNVFFKPIWESNPISGQILGICSALAVTVQLNTANLVRPGREHFMAPLAGQERQQKGHSQPGTDKDPGQDSAPH